MRRGRRHRRRPVRGSARRGGRRRGSPTCSCCATPSRCARSTLHAAPWLGTFIAPRIDPRARVRPQPIGPVCDARGVDPLVVIALALARAGGRPRRAPGGARGSSPARATRAGRGACEQARDARRRQPRGGGRAPRSRDALPRGDRAAACSSSTRTCASRAPTRPPTRCWAGRPRYARRPDRHGGVPRHDRRGGRAHGPGRRIGGDRDPPRRPGRHGPRRPRPARRRAAGAWLVLEDVSELRRLQRIRTEFIDNLSHELRTPLTTVSLLAETLTREADAAGDADPAAGCASGSARSRSRPATSSRWSTSCSTCRASRAAARSSWSTASTSARSPSSRPSGCACSPSARASTSTVDEPEPAAGPGRRRAARPGRRQPRPQRGQVQPGRRRSSRSGVRPGATTVVVVGRGPRGRHPAGRPGPRLRALLQGRSGAPASGARRRHGARPGHRPPRRRAATAAASGSSRRRASGSTFSFALPDRLTPDRAEEARGPPARRDAEHPQPGRPLAGAAAAHPRRHGGAPAGPARAPGGRLRHAAGPPHRGGGRGALRAAPGLGRPAGVRQQPARPGAARRRPASSGWTSGSSASAHRAVVALPGRRDRPRRRDPPPPPRSRRRPRATSRPASCSTGSTTRRRPTRRSSSATSTPSRPSRPTRGWSRRASGRPTLRPTATEPAVTWPSGLQAPAMDTDGDPGCLDYIWVRGAVRVAVVPPRVRPTRPGGPDALPERPPRASRTRLEIGVGSGVPVGPSGWPIAATGGTAPENTLAALTAALAIAACDGVEFDVRTLGRRRAGPPPRRDAGAGRRAGRSDRRAADRRGARATSASRPWPTSWPRAAGARSSTSSSRATPGPAVVEVLAAGRGPDLDRAPSSSFDAGGARADRRAGTGLAALAQHAGTWNRRRSRWRSSSAASAIARGVAVRSTRTPCGARPAAGLDARGLDGPRPTRRSTGSPVSACSRSASRRRRSTADRPADATRGARVATPDRARDR